MQIDAMTREKQINFRVSEDEAARFDRVAQHYGIAMAAMLRMLVKAEDEKIQRSAEVEARRSDQPDEAGQDVLWCFSGPDVDDRVGSADIAGAMNGAGWNAKWKGLPGALNRLCDAGYLRRFSGTDQRSRFSYELTEKGRAYVQSHWRPARPADTKR